jgi:DNA-binding FadR family transcriptional regulator
LDLAARFKVSRSRVREALLAMEQEGTVAMEPYKGAVVKHLSAKETLDIAQVRLASLLWRRNWRTVIFPQLILTLLRGFQND